MEILKQTIPRKTKASKLPSSPTKTKRKLAKAHTTIIESKEMLQVKTKQGSSPTKAIHKSDEDESEYSESDEEQV